MAYAPYHEIISHRMDCPYTGKRLGVAILDSGICPTSDFLLPRNRIRLFRDLINGRKMPYDDNGHGTQVKGAKKSFSQKKLSKSL